MPTALPERSSSSSPMSSSVSSTSPPLSQAIPCVKTCSRKLASFLRDLPPEVLEGLYSDEEDERDDESVFEILDDDDGEDCEVRKLWVCFVFVFNKSKWNKKKASPLIGYTLRTHFLKVTFDMSYVKAFLRG